MKAPTVSESQAARIVAATTNCQCTQLDPGGGALQLADYEITDSWGKRLGLLEVTSTVVGELVAFERAQRKYRIADDRLHFDWFLVTDRADASMRGLQGVLADLLVMAEANGMARPTPEALLPGFNYFEGDEPQTSLHNSGISMISALPRQGNTGHVFVKPPAQGGFIGPDLVTKAVQVELERPDNLSKLEAARAGERAELFVWLDEGSAGMALTTPRLFPQFESSYPKDGPTLPSPITRVWAATGPNDRDVLACALWMTEGGVWQVLQSPPRLS